MSLSFVAPTGQGEFPTRERCHITELCNSPAIADVSVARARVEVDVTTERHVLDCHETYIIEQGTGRFEGGDGETVEVAAGWSIDIPAGTAQQITNTGVVDLVFLCICRQRFKPTDYHPAPEGANI